MTTSGIMFSIAVVVLVSELCSGSGQSGVNQKVWETVIQTEYSTCILKPKEFKVSVVQGRDCTNGKRNSCKTMDSKCLVPFMSTRKPTSSAAATASCGSSSLLATEIDTTDITDIQSDSLTSDSSSNKCGFVDLDLDLGSLGGRGGYEIPMKKAARFSSMGSMNSVDSFDSQSHSSQSQVRLISGGASVSGRREHATPSMENHFLWIQKLNLLLIVAMNANVDVFDTWRSHDQRKKRAELYSNWTTVFFCDNMVVKSRCWTMWMVPMVACWRMNDSQGQRAGGERFSWSECSRMKDSQGHRAGGWRVSGSPRWKMKGFQGQRAGGWRCRKGRVVEDEGFSGAECWGWRVPGASCCKMKGSQG